MIIDVHVVYECSLTRPPLLGISTKCAPSCLCGTAASSNVRTRLASQDFMAGARENEDHLLSPLLQLLKGQKLT